MFVATHVHRYPEGYKASDFRFNFYDTMLYKIAGVRFKYDANDYLYYAHAAVANDRGVPSDELGFATPVYFTEEGLSHIEWGTHNYQYVSLI